MKLSGASPHIHALWALKVQWKLCYRYKNFWNERNENRYARFIMQLDTHLCLQQFLCWSLSILHNIMKCVFHFAFRKCCGKMTYFHMFCWHLGTFMDWNSRSTYCGPYISTIRLRVVWILRQSFRSIFAQLDVINRTMQRLEYSNCFKKVNGPAAENTVPGPVSEIDDWLIIIGWKPLFERHFIGAPPRKS